VGPRRRGRPRGGWREEVERERKVLGVRRWREMVTDRKKWKEIVQQAKAHSGHNNNNNNNNNNNKTVVKQTKNSEKCVFPHF
jgi:uncharacterized protein